MLGGGASGFSRHGVSGLAGRWTEWAATTACEEDVLCIAMVRGHGQRVHADMRGDVAGLHVGLSCHEESRTGGVRLT